MPAAYYDIISDEGGSFKLNLKFMDKNKKSVNMLNPHLSPTVIEGFEDNFPQDSQGNILPFKAYVRMQVRDSVDGDILPVDLNDGTGGSDTSLWGQSNLCYPHIQIKLTNGGTNKDENNILIAIDAQVMGAVDYGNFLYDIEVVFSQDIIDHPQAVVFRILQGRFVITPNITR
jgi:hypothetical protein